MVRERYIHRMACEYIGKHMGRVTETNNAAQCHAVWSEAGFAQQDDDGCIEDIVSCVSWHKIQSISELSLLVRRLFSESLFFTQLWHSVTVRRAGYL